MRIRKKIDRMLNEEVIQPTETEWASLVVFVSSGFGILRFCVDYRELYFVTVRDFYPFSRRDESIDWLGEAQVFLTLDASSDC